MDTHDSTRGPGYGSDFWYSAANLTERIMAGIKSTRHQPMLAQKPFCTKETRCQLSYLNHISKRSKRPNTETNIVVLASIILKYFEPGSSVSKNENCCLIPARGGFFCSLNPEKFWSLLTSPIQWIQWAHSPGHEITKIISCLAI